MPSSMTHTYFGIDVYNNLPKNYQNNIKNNLEYFKLFSQGSDPFMFYHFLIGKKAKKADKIQQIMHHTKTKKFFINTIKFIHENNLTNDEAVMAYLYGYICHYSLDYHTHPYISYKSGIFQKKDKNTYKYNGLHQKIEYAIDYYYLSKNETTNPTKIKVYQKIFNLPSYKNFPPNLEKIINTTISKTYNINSPAPLYLKSIKYMKKFFHLANHDPYGIKWYLYQIIDKITPKNIINIKELSYYSYSKTEEFYLNLEHKIWYLPWDKTKTSTKSFLDLYQDALNTATKLIIETTDLLIEKKLNIKKLEKLFPNLSFSTGLDCKIKVTPKYFEF